MVHLMRHVGAGNLEVWLEMLKPEITCKSPHYHALPDTENMSLKA
jgi:hypothetical protein